MAYLYDQCIDQRYINGISLKSLLSSKILQNPPVFWAGDPLSRAHYCVMDVRAPFPQPMPLHHSLHCSSDVLPEGLNSRNFFGRYSHFSSFYYWLDIGSGICVPSKCSEEDIALLAKGSADNYGLEYRRNF